MIVTKLIVAYPRPLDVEALQGISRRTCASGSGQAFGKDQDRRD